VEREEITGQRRPGGSESLEWDKRWKWPTVYAGKTYHLLFNARQHPSYDFVPGSLLTDQRREIHSITCY